MSIRVGTTSRAITSFGGTSLLRETARAVGLDEAVEQSLHLKARARGLSESQFVVGMAESIALGARCLDDLAVTRADAAQNLLRGYEIPAPQTAGAWLRRFTLGHIGQLNKALEIVQRNAIVASGAAEVTLDFDSTYVFSRSTRRQGVDRTYKRRYALHPMLCFEASSGVAIHARLRRGKSGPSSGIGTFVRETLRRVPPGVSVRSRLDSGFYSGALFEQLEKANVTYLCGVPLIPKLLEICTRIGQECWRPCLDKEEGEVAEFGYRMLERRAPFRRYVVKRIALEEGQQLSFDGGTYRYWIFVTNDHERSAVALESEHRHKADVEAGMRELKSNFGLHAFRKHGFMVNWAWLLLVCLGHNLCCWTQQTRIPRGGSRGWRPTGQASALPLSGHPAMVVRSGRRFILRLHVDYPYLEQFTAALTRLEILRAPPI